MKVLMINGSPNREGCTYTALKEIETELHSAGIETEIVQIGKAPVRGCTACMQCKDSRCVFDDDIVNRIIEKAEQADGIILGSPVHFAAAAGSLSSVLDRAFFAGRKAFTYKPGAAIVSLRRGGDTSAFDQLNKYFTIASMPVVSSRYWNMVFGNSPDEVRQDAEGMKIMRTLGRNMAWLLGCIEAGKNAGIKAPWKFD